METQTRYDLNAAIENWRVELAAQAGLTPEIRRELETHLSDLISEFRRKGLSDEESFRRACIRIGQIRQIGKEFKKNRIFTTSKRATGYGMAAGLVMFLFGLWLASRPNSILIQPFMLFNAPALGLLIRLHDASYNWFSNAGLAQLLAAFLIYWTTLGTLVGFVLGFCFKPTQNRKAPKHA